MGIRGFLAALGTFVFFAPAGLVLITGDTGEILAGSAIFSLVVGVFTDATGG